MQNEDAVARVDLANAKSFSLSLKNRALKILIDYSLDTGKKWQAIRSEIMAVVEAGETDFAPLLTRQDLESWAAQKSTLGDDKFRLVLQYLTHPSTLARPEFDRAKLLSIDGAIERHARVFDEFFTSFAAASLYFRASALHDLTPEIIAARKAAYEGLYVSRAGAWSICLSISPVERCDAFLAHLFTWPGSAKPPTLDWNMMRFSGFSTIGGQIRLHLKGVVEHRVTQNYIAPHYDRATKRISTIDLLHSSFVSEILGNQVREGLDDASVRMRYYDARPHIVRLEHTNDEALKNFVDQFRESLVL